MIIKSQCKVKLKIVFVVNMSFCEFNSSFRSDLVKYLTSRLHEKTLLLITKTWYFRFTLILLPEQIFFWLVSRSFCNKIPNWFMK